MKLTAVLLLCAVSLYLGFERSAGLRGRCTALESFAKMVTRCENALRYLSPSVTALFAELAEAGTGPLGAFVERCLALCRGSDFHAAYRQALSELPAALTPADRELIASFGAGLGKSDLAGQLALCALTLKTCDAALLEARDSAARLSSLYINLGALGGIAAAVILL